MWRTLGAIIWSLICVALVTLAFVYPAISAYNARSFLGFLNLLAIIGILIVLFVVEGAEVAAFSLLDKDAEQISDRSTKDAFVRLQIDPHGFLTGRQLLVVAAIVVLTLLSDSLAAKPQTHNLGRFGEFLFSENTRQAFAFAFPTFIVLWFAQLLPKFLAQERPLRVFGWSVTKTCIYFGIFLGRLQIGSPSKVAMKLLEKADLEKSGDEELLPSRAHHYRSSATLRGGRGIERADIKIEIGATGVVTVVWEMSMKSYGPGFRTVTMQHRWGASIRQDSCTFEPLHLPNGGGDPTIEGPSIFLVDFDANTSKSHVQNGGLMYTVGFQDAIPIGQEFKFLLKYATDAGACESSVGKDDYYGYTVKSPTAVVQVTIVPADDAQFVLSGGKCTAEMSGEHDVDASEASRAKMKAHEGGYRFTINHPLEGTRFIFGWTIARPMPPRRVE